MSQIGSQKEEYSSSEDLPYKFNGKQFDEETGSVLLRCKVYESCVKYLVWGGCVGRKISKYWKLCVLRRESCKFDRY